MPATTGGLTPTRENLFQVGCGKQSVWATPVAPTWFSRWLEGTDINADGRLTSEREGDTSPHVSLSYKTGQYWTIKIVEYLRPITAGFTLQALLGSGSDTLTAATASSTLSAPVVAGATTFNVAASIGTVGNAYFAFTPGYSSATFEVLQVNLASKSGAGPFTYTLVAGQTFANAHSTSDVVINGSTHTLTRTSGYYDAFTVECGFGSTAQGLIQPLRIQDAVCYDVQLESTAGHPLKLSHSWYGTLSKLTAALTAATFEGFNVIGTAGSPLTHMTAGSSWNLDGAGAGVGNGATVKSLRLSMKNSTDAMDFHTEGLNPVYFIPGNFTVSAAFTAKFNSYAQWKNAVYGSPTATTGAADAIQVGFGSLAVTWANLNINGSTDGLNSLALSLPNMAYEIPKMQPKASARALEVNYTTTPVKSVAQPTPLTLTLVNTQNTAY